MVGTDYRAACWRQESNYGRHDIIAPEARRRCKRNPSYKEKQKGLDVTESFLPVSAGKCFCLTSPSIEPAFTEHFLDGSIEVLAVLLVESLFDLCGCEGLLILRR